MPGGLTAPTSRDAAGDGNRHAWGAAVALAALAVAAFYPVLSNGFIDFDDPLYVADNAHVTAGLTWEGLRWAFSLSHNGQTYWHPLTWLSLMLDVQLFGVSATAIHAVNLALHAGAAILLYLALEAMTGRPGRSAAAAMLWVVHPMNVEAVAWAVERKTVLSGFLAFAALLAYAKRARRPAGTGGPGMATVATLLGLGMLAKPTLATLPFLFLLLDAWPLGRTRWAPPERRGDEHRPVPLARLLLEKAPLFAVVVAGLTVAFATNTAPVGVVPLAQRLSNAAVGFWAYAAKAIWPAKLALFYPYPLVVGLAPWKAVAAAGGLFAALVALAWPRLRVGPLVGLLWFLGCLLPMSGIVRSGLWPGMADRFAYLPLAGLMVAVVWWIAPMVEAAVRRRFAMGATAAVTVAFAARSNAYARKWRDSETLFRAAVAVTERATIMRVDLGKALEALGRFDEARAQYEALIAEVPQAPDGYVNLGALRQAGGDVVGAEALYLRALELDPGNSWALYDLGLLRKLGGRAVEARELFERAIRAGFRKAMVHDQLGALYSAEGRLTDAELAFRMALEADPQDWMAAYNLARILVVQGRVPEAEQLLDEARGWALRRREDPKPIDELRRALSALRRVGP